MHKTAKRLWRRAHRAYGEALDRGEGAVRAEQLAVDVVAEGLERECSFAEVAGDMDATRRAARASR